jgi:hypothetical protein
MTLALCLLACGVAWADGPAVATSPAATQAASAPAELLGAWATSGAKPMLMLFDPVRVLMFADGRLDVMKVQRYEAAQVQLTAMGTPLTLRWQLKDGKLSLPIGGKTEVFTRMGPTPAELQISPMKLPAGVTVPADRVEKVRQELAERLAKDQALRKSPELKADAILKQDAQNVKYLKSQMEDLGWIDVKRFDVEAARAAFVLVQHSGNLPMMLAALPEIERDVKAGSLDAQGFAMLFDRLQLMMGEKQRYGTQIGKQNGRLVVMPLEDKAKVDAYRKELKLPPLAEYLETVKQQTGAKEVVIE